MADRIDQLKKILAEEPNDAFCLYGLAQEHAKLGQHDVAIEYYDRTLAVDPDYCYAYFHKARSQEEAGDVEGAKATLRAGFERAKDCDDAKAAGEIAGYLDSLT